MPNVAAQVTTIFGLAAFFFVFALFVIRGHEKLLEAVKPQDPESDGQRKEYIRELAKHRILMNRWLLGAFAGLLIVVFLLVFQTYFETNTQHQIDTLTFQVSYLTDQVETLKGNVTDRVKEVNDCTAQLAARTNNQAQVKSTLFDG